MQELIAEVHRITENNSGSTLNVCFSYTSRDEMTHAVREAVALVERKQIKREDIDAQLIESLLYTSAKVDLLVRTSGRHLFLTLSLSFAQSLSHSPYSPLSRSHYLLSHSPPHICFTPVLLTLSLSDLICYCRRM